MSYFLFVVDAKIQKSAHFKVSYDTFFNFHVVEALRLRTAMSKFIWPVVEKAVLLHSGKSYTTSSHWIPQGRNAARAFGCSGAI